MIDDIGDEILERGEANLVFQVISDPPSSCRGMTSIGTRACFAHGRLGGLLVAT
ncbi:hypothetical protein AB0L05_00540 [Nonomuraea pusilla]|uniref:hypothetical protein n=1 Tax=Nonomuraea pusilla TaxID=46177 RepID=UPI003331C071